MTRACWVTLAGILLLQTQAAGDVSVTVQANPPACSFMVDGLTYVGAQLFYWVPGSPHTIGTTSPQSGGAAKPFA